MDCYSVVSIILSCTANNFSSSVLDIIHTMILYNTVDHISYNYQFPWLSLIPAFLIFSFHKYSLFQWNSYLLLPFSVAAPKLNNLTISFISWFTSTIFIFNQQLIESIITNIVKIDGSQLFPHMHMLLYTDFPHIESIMNIVSLADNFD